MATILRHDGSQTASTTASPRPVAFNFDDMNDRASEYLETVRREAAKIVQQAHQEAEQVRRQAEVAGRAAAEAAAHKAIDEKIGLQLGSIIPALEQLLAELNDAKAEWMRHWEESAIAVATTIAERIIRREIEQRPEITLDWISESLRLAAGGSEVTLRLNPADHENLRTQVERIAHSLGKLAPTSVVADPEITPGGCVVDTRFGQIDQQIESQIARIREELK
jgi:flagellar assembly protein FliH